MPYVSDSEKEAATDVVREPSPSTLSDVDKGIVNKASGLKPAAGRSAAVSASRREGTVMRAQEPAPAPLSTLRLGETVTGAKAPASATRMSAPSSALLGETVRGAQAPTTKKRTIRRQEKNVVKRRVWYKTTRKHKNDWRLMSAGQDVALGLQAELVAKAGTLWVRLRQPATPIAGP